MFGQFIGREMFSHVCGPERTELVFLCSKGAPFDHFSNRRRSSSSSCVGSTKPPFIMTGALCLVRTIFICPSVASEYARNAMTIVVCQGHECTTVGVYLDVTHADHVGHSTRVLEGVTACNALLVQCSYITISQARLLGGNKKNKHK